MYERFLISEGVWSRTYFLETYSPGIWCGPSVLSPSSVAASPGHRSLLQDSQHSPCTHAHTFKLNTGNL